MNNTDLMSLGELYKELRIARGLRLKDVARDNLSVSQLSKFENGQSMLAADKLLLAISGIHMTFAEFGHAVNGYKVSDFFS
ncbi:transcriptional regulator [Streptococcus equi subsp. equi]|uniref:Transcriptional regulator n=1 Tax=Streptococcus equi subsp. equi TaxID=148942 RepID=A0A380JN06_9STRE|nr:transcriptional regulator [Streptococcus equi subsp. equi]